MRNYTDFTPVDSQITRSVHPKPDRGTVCLYNFKVIGRIRSARVASMEILALESLQSVIFAANALLLSTILTCYGLAVWMKHVPAWLPMISDCAVESPEKYPFRMGLVLGAFLLMFEVVAVYKSDRAFSKDRMSLTLGCIASFGLAVVGVVNEKENNTVHSGGAVIFFMLFDVYMILMSWNVTLDPDSPKWSIYLKQGCALVCTVALSAFVYMSTDWGKYRLWIAIAEWLGTFCILLFHASFAADLNYIAILEANCKDEMNGGGHELDMDQPDDEESVGKEVQNELLRSSQPH